MGAWIVTILAALTLLATAGRAEAAPREIVFTPSGAALLNPERGWWLAAVEDFRTITADDLGWLHEQGATLVYGVVRLDDWRDGPISDAALEELRAAFATARAAGVKVILRFAYNYPASSQDYERAEDAPLDVVLGHIAQLGPLLAAEADTIVVLQAGFIGAWGEGHSSSNALATPEAKEAIRDALARHVPGGLQIQWRYPPDLMAWPAGERARFGLHNDCFLSSPTDVGTYDEDPGIRELQRAFAAGVNERHFFSGETCDADATAIRPSCAEALAEGARFHLSALNGEYYEAFHRAWEAGGCRDEIGLRMGYRLALVSARLEDGGAEVTLRNEGWARPVQPRPLILTAWADGAEVGRATLGPATLDRIGPGETATLSAAIRPSGTPDLWCLAAPDRSARLAPDPRFAIRFANADSDGQGWDADRGAFCFR